MFFGTSGAFTDSLSIKVVSHLGKSKEWVLIGRSESLGFATAFMSTAFSMLAGLAINICTERRVWNVIAEAECPFIVTVFVRVIREKKLI
jgi:hypothetical protein